MPPSSKNSSNLTITNKDKAMRKIGIMLIVAAAMLTMGSCGGKQQAVPFDDGDSANVANSDPTVYGLCGVETTMNTLQLLTDNGDTLTFDLSRAKSEGRLLGGLQVGDRMAVVPDSARTEALVAINQSTLLGNWIMPNPIDGSDEVGIRIKEGGVAESINQSTIVYRTWRLLRGQLEIVYTREDGSGEEETYLYQIVKLNADSLVYKDDEDTFEYGRQRAHKDPVDQIKLEDVEDFDI